ncbi:MAG: (Fe-S)-binding protein [Pseudomonadota bacterium]
MNRASPDREMSGDVGSRLALDWSAYAQVGQGDAYAGIPKSGGDFARAVSLCMGNRACQRKDKGVMCPSFRITDDPRHSTHERVQALKAALNGEWGDDPFNDPRLWAAMDLCVACKGCKRECPNGVDMAALKVEARAQRNARHGVPLRDRLIASLPRLLDGLPGLGLSIRLRNRLPWLRALGERLFGIAAQRDLPEPARRPHAMGGSFEPVGETVGEVVLLVDTWTRHFEPGVADDAIAVLGAAGYRVWLADPPSDAAHAEEAPERALCCGRSYLAAGMVNAAHAEASRLLEALRPHLDAGRAVVGLEPSCLLSLKDEYRQLGLDEDLVARLARQVFLLEDFLAAELAAKRLRLNLRAMPEASVLVHGHCHHKAFGGMKAVRKVLGLIPELKFELLETACCGMAGGFGYEAEHYEVSMRMAEQTLLPAVRAAPEGVVVLADGFSCRQQIADGAGRPAHHTVSLLRQALAEPQSSSPA